MKEAIKEVFEGKHPTEEGGCLYRSEAIREAQLRRTLEEKTNNHLVRHRVLITRRLVKDIIKSYMSGDAAQVGRITIEVNRDLQAFSGKSNKDIESELDQMLKDHTGVVKKLEKDFKEAGKSYRITAGLIRKARIAADLGWRCPYTGKDFDAIDLVERAYDKDHIIPRSLRPSDSLESLVITSPEVNKMKGNRTALQFIREDGGKDIEGSKSVGETKANLFSEKEYRQFISKLDIRNGHKQDKERKKKRRDLLELEKYEEKGFLPKDLTQTSHLVRLAATEIEKEFNGLENKPRIISLPGSVTGEVRKGWKLYGCLAAHNPEVQKLLERAETEELNIKKELRDITHLHHALDACVIGYTSHFLPNEGGLWEALTKRNRRPEETELLLTRGIFSRDSEDRARLAPLRDEIKQQIAKRLGECRVVQHVPKRMGGLAGLEENTRGIMAIEVPDTARPGKKSKETKLKEIWNNESGQPLPVLENLNGVVVRLRQYGPRDPKNHDKRERKPTHEKAAKLLGLRPENGNGKLRAIKGVRVVEANFDLALWRKDGKPDGDPMMRILLWHKVWPQLKAIAEKENGGKWPGVLRNGNLISVPKGIYQGIWKVASVKANLTIDMMFPQKVTLESKGYGQKREVSVITLLDNGMTIMPHKLTGISACPTTSSA
jgi:CRISPR-associated endonuclease Csn1